MRSKGLPPAVALQQQRGSPTTRSSVGSVTTLSNLLRMLYSRAGDYPPGQPLLYAESFSPNTPEGACPHCHGLGRVYDVTEQSMVPDDSLTIRERAIAAWPPAWHGQNLRDIVTTLGYDIDTPWRELPKKDRDWLLFTDEQPVVPVYAGWDREEVRRAIKRKEPPSYMGTFTGAKKYVLETFAKTESASMKKRVARYMVSSECPLCHGKRLRAEALSVKFAGLDIAEISALPLKRLAAIVVSVCRGEARRAGRSSRRSIRRRRWSRSASRRISARGSPCCSISGSAIFRSIAARPRFRPANCSGCASRPRCARIFSASSMCSTNLPPACIRRTRRRCSTALGKAEGVGQFALRRRA